MNRERAAFPAGLVYCDVRILLGDFCSVIPSFSQEVMLRVKLGIFSWKGVC